MNQLQARAGAWVLSTLGVRILRNRKERALRVLEEAVELAQAEGVRAEEVARVVFRTFTRPPGEPTQEAAGVAVMILAYAEGIKLDLAAETARELTRIEDPAVRVRCREKQREKAAAGTGHLPEDG